MTPSETKKRLEWIDRNRPVMEAFVAGAKVQVRSAQGDAWSPATGPVWTVEFEYRVKPEPKTRPYTVAELKEQVGKVFVRKGDGYTSIAAGCINNCLFLTVCGNASAAQLFDEFTHKDGSPCGVTE